VSLIQKIENVRQYVVWKAVAEVQLNAMSTKTRVLPEIQIYTHRVPHTESTLLDDLLAWICYSEWLKPIRQERWSPGRSAGPLGDAAESD